MAATISTVSEELLARLRAEVESPAKLSGSGERWGTVYLANARPEGMTAHQFAGHLSALEAAGLYRPELDKQFRGFFGYVKIS